MSLDFSRCRDVWVPDNSEAGGFWSPPPPHVKYGVEWIVERPYAMLADDMGGMKTAQAIIAAQFMSERGVIDRAIVVAPASVRPKVWFDKDLGQLHEQVWQGKRNVVSEYHARIRSWETEGTGELRWIVTNYEFIRVQKNLAALLQYCTPKTLLIFDESSAVKGWDSKQTLACMLLRWHAKKNRKGEDVPVLGVPRCGRVLLLNGTPVADSPLDMFAQCNLMHPSILDCHYITHYKARYSLQVPVLGYGGKALKDPRGNVIQRIDKWTNLDDLQRRCAPYVLRREAKDLGIDFALPPVGLEVPLTPTTWRHYCTMRDEMVVWLKSDVATAATAAVKSMRLAQITSGFLGGIEDPGIGEDPIDDGLLGSIDLDVSGIEGVEYDLVSHGGRVMSMNKVVHAPVVEVGREKLDFALAWQAELLERHPDLKLLTWCRFVPELRRYLGEVSAKFQHPVGAACGASVLGESVKKEREAALRLLHPKTAPSGPATVGGTQGTGALGLNFTACRTVLDMSYDFSPWKKKQGDARVNRPGQTGPVSFFYLIAVGPKGQKTIDHHVMMTRLGKANINDWTTSAWVKALTEE